MKSLNNSSGCSESFTDTKTKSTDLIKDQESESECMSYIDYFRPTSTHPKPTFENGYNILLIALSSRVEDILSNIYSVLQDQIDTLYVFSDNHENIDQKLDSVYHKITDHVFSIDLLHGLMNMIIKKKLKQQKQLLILDCKVYSNSLLKSRDFLNFVHNTRHYNVTLILVARHPTGLLPELRSSFSHIIMDGTYSNSTMKMLYEHYLGMFPNYSVVHTLQRQMSKEDVIHVFNNGSSHHKTKIYPMTLINDNLKLNDNLRLIVNNIVNNTDVGSKVKHNAQDWDQDYDEILKRVNNTIDELIEIRNLIKSKRSLQ